MTELDTNLQLSAKNITTVTHNTNARNKTPTV